MKRKATSILLGCLSVMLVAVFSVTVYAALQSSLRISNTISFTPNSQNIFYEANAIAYYKGEKDTGPKASTWIDNSTHTSTDPSRNEGNMYEVPSFKKDKRTIVYEITVSNYTSDANLNVSFTLTNPEIMYDSGEDKQGVVLAVTNMVDTTISGQMNGNAGLTYLTQDGNRYSFELSRYTMTHLQTQTAPSVTFYIETTCHYFGESYKLHNDFTFSLTKVE